MMKGLLIVDPQKDFYVIDYNESPGVKVWDYLKN